MAVLRMANPLTDPRTRILYLQVRVPADFKGRLAGQRIAVPVGEEYRTVRIGTQVVKVSLLTRDPSEGRARFATANAFIMSFWDTQRRGPKPLTHKQRVALAGEVRGRITAAYDDDPGQIEMWRDVIAVNDYIKNGSGILPGQQAGDTATQEETAEYRYGKALDAHLAERQLVLDPIDRPALIAAVSKAMDEAAHVNLRRAEGDYGPDEGECRYPTFEASQPSQAPNLHSGWTFERAINDEVERRRRSRDAKPLRPNTVAKYRRVVASILTYRGNDDIASLTTRDVNGWVSAM